MSSFSSYSTGTMFTTWISPVTPSITSPTEGQTSVSRNPTITSSVFSSPDSLTHTSSTWQIATDSGFSSVVWSKSADTTNKTSIVVNSTNGTFAGDLSGKTSLAVSTAYYVRVKYTDNESTDSSYSTGVSFTVRASQIIRNAVDVQSPWDADLPDSAAKPSMIGTGDGTPADSVSDGTMRIDSDYNDVYFRSNSVWKKLLTSGNSTTTEEVQDAVGAMVADTTTIDVTYTDATPELKWDVKVDSINDTHIDWGSGANQVNLDDVPDGSTYVKLSATNHTDLTDSGATTLHKHDHGGQDGLSDDDHTQYLLATGTRTGASSQAQTFTNGVTSSGAFTASACQTVKYLAITSLRTLDATDYIVDCTANTFTVTLPTAVGIQGRVYVIKNSGTGTITIDGNGSQTIDGLENYVISTQYNSVTIVSDNANWKVI